MSRVLVLGGTGLARQLAAALHRLDVVPFITSLAGRTRTPHALSGPVRVGGFGGARGLLEFVRNQAISHIVVASHPFAATITRSAADSAAITGLPICRLMAPPWSGAEGDNWHLVPSVRAAADALPAGARALVTSGHKELADIIWREDCRLLIRLIEPPARPLPAHCDLLLGQPPYELARERQIFSAHRLSHLVSKNAGGEATAGKLVVAREAGASVLMIGRPADPVRPVFHNTDEVVNWLRADLSL